MSICIISDHIIMLRQNFIHDNTQNIDQIKPKYEGRASAPKAPKAPPGSAPGLVHIAGSV